MHLARVEGIWGITGFGWTRIPGAGGVKDTLSWWSELYLSSIEGYLDVQGVIDAWNRRMRNTCEKDWRIQEEWIEIEVGRIPGIGALKDTCSWGVTYAFNRTNKGYLKNRCYGWIPGIEGVGDTGIRDSNERYLEIEVWWIPWVRWVVRDIS